MVFFLTQVLGCSPRGMQGTNPYRNPPTRFQITPTNPQTRLGSGAIFGDFRDTPQTQPDPAKEAERSDSSGEAIGDTDPIIDESGSVSLDIPPMTVDSEVVPPSVFQNSQNRISQNRSPFHRSVQKVHAHFLRDAAGNARKVSLDLEIKRSQVEIEFGRPPIDQIKIEFDLSDAQPSDFRVGIDDDMFKREAQAAGRSDISGVLRCGLTPDCHFADFEVIRTNSEGIKETMNLSIHTRHLRLFSQANLQALFGDRLTQANANEMAILQRAVNENWLVIQTVIHAKERDRYFVSLQVVEPTPEPDFHYHDHESEQNHNHEDEGDVTEGDSELTDSGDSKNNGSVGGSSEPPAEIPWSVGDEPKIALTFSAQVLGSENLSLDQNNGVAPLTSPAPHPRPDFDMDDQQAGGDKEQPSNDRKDQSSDATTIDGSIEDTNRDLNSPIPIKLIASYGRDSVCGDTRLKGIPGWINGPDGSANSRSCGRRDVGQIEGATITEVAGVKIGNGQGVFLSCEMAKELAHWMTMHAQHSAIVTIGDQIVNTRAVGGFSCRSRNNGTPTTRTSQHAFGHAFDVQFFVFSNGSQINVETHHRRASVQRDFLTLIGQKSCGVYRDRGFDTGFGTVLGPGAALHDDHFHLDLELPNRQNGLPRCNVTRLFPTPSR